jgi:hypothetical protein
MDKRFYLKIALLLLPVFNSTFLFKSAKADNGTGIFAPDNSIENQAKATFDSLKLHGLELETFMKAFKGYYALEKEGKVKNHVLSIVDFSQSSKKERLYVIDMAKKELIYNSLVAHGKKSGEEFANSFANILDSGKSSLGFYVTGETYYGKHGYSLRLDGMESCNNEARSRAIVMHSADYVSYDFIKKNGRLGRSQGCPALPVEISEKVINVIKDGSCLFMYHPSEDYLSNSCLIQ